MDATQLFKHAFALRSEVHRREPRKIKPILFYLYAEPEVWPANGEAVDDEAKARHRGETEAFGAAVADGEVSFVSCTWRHLLDAWTSQPDGRTRAHAQAVRDRFSTQADAGTRRFDERRAADRKAVVGTTFGRSCRDLVRAGRHDGYPAGSGAYLGEDTPTLLCSAGCGPLIDLIDEAVVNAFQGGASAFNQMLYEAHEQVMSDTASRLTRLSAKSRLSLSANVKIILRLR